MLVERVTWLAKVGCHGEVIKLLRDLQDFNEQLGIGVTERVYSCMFGANDESIVVELEFETMEERQKSWAEWFKHPEAHEATRRMRELIRSGGVHEIWRLH